MPHSVMTARNLLPLLGLTIAALAFGESDALARGRHYYHSYRPHYRRPPPPRPPRAPPKPPAPKTLQSSGTVLSLSTLGKSLSLKDDNTKTVLRLTITPQTKFTRSGNPILADSIQTYAHLTVSYQDTDGALKEVKITPLPGAAQPGPKNGKPAKVARQR